MNNNSIEIINIVRDTIETHKLINQGESVLVALSGGADSVSMLHILCNLKDKLNIKIGAAHLNHMIRGAEADRDEAYSAEICTKLNIPFYAERVDVPLIAKSKGISEELAGRQARYDFFNRLKKEYGYTCVATAHNRNDRAETVLMRIIRGTGIDGLTSIKYKREDGVIRPLLDLDRKKIEEYCRDNDLDFCNDSTNIDVDYTRNRIRCELIPFLKDKFNPSIIDALCSLSDNATEDAEFINGYSNRLYNRINSPIPKNSPRVIDINSLKVLDKSIVSRVLRIASKETMGKDYKLEKVHIEMIKNLFNKSTGASVILPEGFKVNVKYGWLEFTTVAQDLTETNVYEFPVEIEGMQKINTLNISFRIVDLPYKVNKNEMIIDYEMVKDKKLYVRNRRIGDRIVLFKDGKSKKLKDYWIDKKIPRNEREDIPLLVFEKNIIAIIGDRVAENYKIKTSSSKGMVITYGASNEDR